MANGLAVWSLVYALHPSMPSVVEEVILPADTGCLEFCLAFHELSVRWAITQGLPTKGAGNCVCVLVRECKRADCGGEKLLSNLQGDP